jgi:hypothetical protein
MAKTERKAAPKGLSVYERRLANPLGKRTREIPLNDDLRKGWTARVFTRDAEHPDRHWQAVHELGYEPCKAEDFAADPESLGFTVNAQGYVTRGQHGQDMVMRIPTKEYQAIQRAKAAANLAAVKPKKLKDEVSQATAKNLGDEAGETVFKHYQQKDIVETVPGGGMGE